MLFTGWLQARKLPKPRLLSLHRKLEDNPTLDWPRIAGSHETDRKDRGRKLQSFDDVTVVGRNRRRKRRKRIGSLEKVYRVEIGLRLDVASDSRLEPEPFDPSLLHVLSFRRLSSKRGLVSVLEQGRSQLDVLHPDWPLFRRTTRSDNLKSFK